MREIQIDEKELAVILLRVQIGIRDEYKAFEEAVYKDSDCLDVALDLISQIGAQIHE